MTLSQHTALIRRTLAELARTAQEAGDEANINALNQASFQVGRGVLANVQADVMGDLLVPSKGDGGTIYRVGQLPCTCTAGRKGKPCWHASLHEAVYVAVGDVSALVVDPAPAVAATIAAITEAVHGMSDTDYARLVAEQDAGQGPAEEAWTEYRRVVEAGDEEPFGAEPWAPNYITELWP